jgi:hypothetical protein
MHGEGADANQSFRDRSPYDRTVKVYGAVQNDTDISVGNSPSIKFDADANKLECFFGDELTITGLDFCFEAYGYCTGLAAGINQIFGRRRNSNNYIMQLSSGNLNFSTFSGTGGTTRLSAAHGMSDNTPYHICVIRVGTTYYGFIDGVLVGSNTSSGTIGADSTSLWIGDSENDQTTRFWRGNLNWMRQTLGDPRYNLAGFTPDSVPYGID